MTRAMVTLFTAKPSQQTAHRRPSGTARAPRGVRVALLGVLSKLS